MNPPNANNMTVVELYPGKVCHIETILGKLTLNNRFRCLD